MKLIYTIIVTYNGAQWIEKCLSSLRKSSTQTKVLAIDNGSSDNTQQLIKENFPEVELIETGTNLGFGKANNIGLKIALENNADYVFLLNQDAWLLDQNSLLELIETHSQNSKYAILSPIHLSGDLNKLDINFSCYLSPVYTPNLLSDFVLNRVKALYETTFVNAAAWLISKECLQNIGGFDPLFPHYGEDDDYVRRIHFHGYKIGIVPNAFIVHDRLPNYNRALNTKTKYITNLLFIKNQTLSSFKNFLSFSLTSILEISNYFLRFQFRNAKISLIAFFKTLVRFKCIRKSNRLSMLKRSTYLKNTSYVC